MDSPLDGIRQKAGVAVPSSVADRPVPRRPTRVPELRDVVAASAARPADLGDTAAIFWASLAISVLTTVGHRPVTSWLAARVEDNPRPISWMLNLLEFGGLDVWAPVVAGLAAATLAVCCILTRGFRQADGQQARALAVSTPIGLLTGLPLALVAIMALLVVLFYIAVAGFVLAGFIMLLIGLVDP